MLRTLNSMTLRPTCANILLITLGRLYEENNFPLFNTLPLRINLRPRYITIDTYILIKVFIKDHKTLISDNKAPVWSQIFKTDCKPFKRNSVLTI